MPSQSFHSIFKFNSILLDCEFIEYGFMLYKVFNLKVQEHTNFNVYACYCLIEIKMQIYLRLKTMSRLLG